MIAVRGRAKIFLGGPPLVKAALGQDADDESLGGAELHAVVTGTTEYLAEDDAHALELAREVIGKLGWERGAGGRRRLARASAPARPPRHDPEEILGIVSPDYRVPYDAREVIARLVDDSDFLEWKALYGPHTVCGHAAIDGHPCGLIANNGPLDTDGSNKAGQFIQLCCQSGTPIVYLQNTTGYMVGKEAEQKGIVKHGSKMIQAVANATVPQLTLHIGASFGAGNYGMCGRAYDPRFLFTWPNAQIAVMGGEQAAGVMTLITEAKWQSRRPGGRHRRARAHARGHRRPDRSRVGRALLDGATVGRRHHRPARQPARARVRAGDLRRGGAAGAAAEHVRRAPPHGDYAPGAGASSTRAVSAARARDLGASLGCRSQGNGKDGRRCSSPKSTSSSASRCAS